MLIEERESRFKNATKDEILQWIEAIGVEDDKAAIVAAQNLFKQYPCRNGNCTKVLNGLLERAEELEIGNSRVLPMARIVSIAMRGILFKASEAQLPPSNSNGEKIFESTLEMAEKNGYLPAEHRLVLFCCRKLSEHSSKLEITSTKMTELYVLLLKECQRDIEEARDCFHPDCKEDTATLFNRMSTSTSLYSNLHTIISKWAGLPNTFDLRELEGFSPLRIDHGCATAGFFTINHVGELCMSDPWRLYKHYTRDPRDLKIASELDPKES